MKITVYRIWAVGTYEPKKWYHRRG